MWSVLQTFSGASDSAYLPTAETHDLPVAIRHLTWQGFKFYNPRSRSRKTGKVRQIFRDYVFVQPGDRWRSLNSTRGVVGLLMAAPEQPGVISDEFVHGLQSLEDDEGFVVLKDRSRFAMGSRVESSMGIGLYDGQRDQDRCYVLMEWLGAKRRVIVREDNLVAA